MNLRNRVISQADFDNAHEGLQRFAKLWDWSIELSPDPSNPRLVTLETLGLVIPEPPTPPEQLGPLDDEGLPAWDDDQTVEAPAVTEIELEGVPDDVPRQTAPMLTFGAANLTVDDIEQPEEPEQLDDVPTLEQWIAHGYPAETYEAFVADFKAERLERDATKLHGREDDE